MGQFVNVRITEALPNSLRGEIADISRDNAVENSIDYDNDNIVDNDVDTVVRLA